MELSERHTASMLNRSRIVMILFLLFIAYFLWTEHRAHTIQYLPFAILLLCPFMHLFMHHGHGGHAGHAGRGDHGGATDTQEGHQGEDDR